MRSRDDGGREGDGRERPPHPRIDHGDGIGGSNPSPGTTCRTVCDNRRMGKTYVRECALAACQRTFETDGRREFCSKSCRDFAWRGGRPTDERRPRPAPHSRRHRVTSGYSDKRYDELDWIADEEGVTIAEMQRRIVVRYLSGNPNALE